MLQTYFFPAGRGLLLFCLLLVNAGAVGQECAGPVFREGQLTGTAFVQTQRIQSPTPQNEDYFGDELVVSGDYALSTTDFYDEAADEYYLYIDFFERTGGEWTHTKRIDTDSYHGSGDFFAISGDYVFISQAWYPHPDDSDVRMGKVTIYKHQEGGGWEQTQTLEGNDESLGPISEEFGEYMQVSGNRIAIHYGRPGKSSEIPKSIVRIFELRGDEWQFHSLFQGFDTPYSKVKSEWGSGALFALDGDRIIADMVYGSQYGASDIQANRVVFEYNENSDEWEDTFVFEEGDYREPPPNNYTFNGDDFILQNETAVFTTTEWTPDPDGSSYSGSTGATWIYERNEDGSWTRSGELLGDGEFEIYSLTVDDNLLLAIGDTDNPDDEEVEGLYVFEQTPNGEYEQVAKLKTNDLGQNDYHYFTGLAVSGNTIAFGFESHIEGEEDDTQLPGEVFFYALTPTYTLPAAELAGCAAPAYRPEVTSDCAVTVSADTPLGEAGAYEVTWTATDAAGNRAQATQ